MDSALFSRPASMLTGQGLAAISAQQSAGVTLGRRSHRDEQKEPCFCSGLLWSCCYSAG